MKTLNLTNLEKSEIKYEISRFPDGQQQVKILKFSELRSILKNGVENYVDVYPDKFNSIKIKSRLNNFKDLELIICATKSLRNLGVKEIHLYTPYFLGCRSDRKFEEGSNNYLKDVICPIINSLKFDSVTVLDPHSDVLEACLNNFKKADNLQLITFAFGRMNNPDLEKDNFVLISPDAGVNKKIFKIAEQIGYNGDIITCSKDRDVNGKLTKTVVPYKHSTHGDKDIIIIDDVCDGGATFINIAKELKENHDRRPFKGKIYLIVTHGIFSKGFKELNKYFDGIYCTNSYVDMDDNTFSLVNDKHLHKLKQLNVF